MLLDSQLLLRKVFELGTAAFVLLRSQSLISGIFNVRIGIRNLLYGFLVYLTLIECWPDQTVEDAVIVGGGVMEFQNLCGCFPYHVLQFLQGVERVVLHTYHVRIVKFPLQLVYTALQTFYFLLILFVIVEQPGNGGSYLQGGGYDRKYHGCFLNGGD